MRTALFQAKEIFEEEFGQGSADTDTQAVVALAVGIKQSQNASYLDDKMEEIVNELESISEKIVL